MLKRITTLVCSLSLFAAAAASAETLINGAGATFPYPLEEAPGSGQAGCSSFCPTLLFKWMAKRPK